MVQGLLAFSFIGSVFVVDASDVHWANPVNGNWNTAANWNPPQVPGPNDRAFVKVDGTYTVTLSAVTTVGGLEVGGATGTQTFTNSQNLILNGPGLIGVNGVWGVGSGGLAGASDVTVSGRFVWNGGTLNRTGTVTIASGGNLLLAGASRVFTSGRLLLQAGAAGNWSSGTMSSGTGSGAILENEGTFDLNGDFAWNTSGTVPPRFINRGLVRKTAGTVAVARLAGTFENEVGGHLRVQAGTMEIHGSSVGRFTLDPDTTLAVASGGTSPNVFGAGAVFEGPGVLSIPAGVTRLDPGARFASPPPALRVQTGELQLNSGQPLNAQALTLVSGRLSGSDTITVTDLATWQAGELAVGLTLVAAGGVDLTGAATRTFNGTLRLPPGTVSNWRAGSINSTAVAHLENFGTMTMLGDMDWTGNFNNPPNLLNRGRWSKAGGTLESSLAVIVNNGREGVLQVSSGTLSLAHGGVCDGVLQMDAGATLRFFANGFSFVLAPNGRLSGLGRCLLGLGSFESQPGSDLSAFQGTFEIDGGTCQLNSASLLTVDSLILSGGTLTGLQRISVTGPTVWRASAIAGSPIIEARGGLYLTNNSIRSFQGGTLLNYGLARWTNGSIASSVGPAVFSNAFGARFEIGGPVSPSWTVGAGSSASFINSGTVTVQTLPNRRLILNVPFENRGDVFLLNSDVLMDVPGSYRQTAGRTVLAGATFRPFSIPIQLDGGELSGSGSIISTVYNNALVLAKDSVGPLTITGSYFQSSQGTLDIDWAGPGAAFAPLQLTGTARLDGALRVNLANGFTPAQGDVRTILTAGTRLGTFAQLNVITTARVAALYSLNSATLEVLPGSFTVNPVTPKSVIEGDPLRVPLGVTPQLPVGALSYAFVNNPVPNATLEPVTGEFTWSPTEEQGPGEYDFTVRVRDSAVPPVSAEITFHVSVLESNRPPVLQSATIPSVLEGTPLQFALQTSDPDLPANAFTYALIANGGAIGLAVSPDGLIEWTPGFEKGPGLYTVQIGVTDDSPNAFNAKNLPDTRSFVIRVDGVNTPPVIDGLGEQTVPPGSPWSWQVPAHDSDLPAETLAYSLSGQPPGMLIDAHGVLSWTPGFDLVGQTWTVRVAVRDTGSGNPANAATAETNLRVKVDRLTPAYGTAPWMRQDIDGIGDAGAAAVIRLDAKGQTHVASLTFGPGAATPEMQVRLAHETGYGFNLETVSSFSLPSPLDETAILLHHRYQQLDYGIAPDGTEHVVVIEPTSVLTGRLRYGRRRPGQNWEWQTLASSWPQTDGVFPLQIRLLGSVVALAVDGNGMPRLAFNAFAATTVVEPTAYQFFYAERRPDETWSLEPLAGTEFPTDHGGNVSLRLDRQNCLHVGLWLGDNEAGIRLEHRVRSASEAWAASAVKESLYPPTGPVAYHHSLVVDAADEPLFAFENPSSHQIEYAWRTGGSWQTETVTEGLRPALALTVDGRPLIAASRNALAHGAIPGRESYTRLWVMTRRDAGRWTPPESFHPPVPAANLEERPALSLVVDEHDTVFGALDTGSYLHDLVLVRTGSPTWTKKIIAEPPPGGRYEHPFLTFDTRGRPHVAATLVLPSVVQPAVFRPSETSLNWVNATFDTPFSDTSRGFYPSLTVAPSGRRALSFYSPADRYGKIWMATSSLADADQMQVQGFADRCLKSSAAFWCGDAILPLLFVVAEENDLENDLVLRVMRGAPPEPAEQTSYVPFSRFSEPQPERMAIVRPPDSSRWKRFTYLLYRTDPGHLHLAIHDGTQWIANRAIFSNDERTASLHLQPTVFHLGWELKSDAPIITYVGSPDGGTELERVPNTIFYAIRKSGNPVVTSHDSRVHSDPHSDMAWTTKFLGEKAVLPGPLIDKVQADYRYGNTVVLFPTPRSPGQPAELRMLVGPAQLGWEEAGPFANDSAHLGESVTDFSFVMNGGRWHIAYINEFGTLKFASRLPESSIFGSPPGYNPIIPCTGNHTVFIEEPPPPRPHDCFSGAELPSDAELAAAAAGAMPPPPSGGGFRAAAVQPPAPLNPPLAAPPDLQDDLAVLRRLRDFMFQSREGIRILDLYYQFNVETGRLGLQDPYLMIDALAVIRNFTPGFVALTQGRGQSGRITKEMIDSVVSVWTRLADRGSPELRAAILGEFARHRGLQDFIGLTFDQWADAMGFRQPVIGILRTERLNSGVLITVNHLEGRSYTLLRSPTLESPVWTPVDNVSETISGYVRLLSDPTPGDGRAFYRVVAGP